MSPRARTEKAEGGGVIGERSYLEILNKSSDLKKESLTSLKQIQLQLRGDSERVDRVSGVLQLNPYLPMHNNSVDILQQTCY